MENHMKKTNFFWLLISCLFITTTFADTKTSSVDKIVVIVNSSVITQNEVNRAMVSTKKQIAAMNAPLPSENKLKDTVINNLIDQELQRQLLKLANIKISEKEIDDAISNIAKHNNLSSAQLRQELIKSGGNFKQYREQIREQMAISRIQQQEVNSNITVSDQEVNQFLKEYKKAKQQDIPVQYHLQNILIPLPDDASSDAIQKAQEQAEQVLKKIRQGEDFNKAATEAALQSSDLGWRRPTDIPAIFAATVKNMKAGEISEPLRAPNGFHLLKLVETHQEASKINLNNKNEIRALIYQRKFEENRRLWLQKLRDSAYIKFV
jgi:peptidyl-prolyl cis-trans isomerase SurA